MGVLKDMSDYAKPAKNSPRAHLQNLEGGLGDASIMKGESLRNDPIGENDFYKKQKTNTLTLIGWWYFGAGLWIKLQSVTLQVYFIHPIIQKNHLGKKGSLENV
jgi:hypothetical protein